jgi:hypothetical protein
VERNPAAKQQEQQELQAQLDQMTAVAAEKDTLLQAVAENARLMNEINAEMAKVQDLKAGVEPVVSGEGGPQPAADQRAIVLARVREITERLNTAESASPEPGLHPAARQAVGSMKTASPRWRPRAEYQR